MTAYIHNPSQARTHPTITKNKFSSTAAMGIPRRSAARAMMTMATSMVDRTTYEKSIHFDFEAENVTYATRAKYNRTINNEL